ncbi:ABC transporter ATP-binding protein [Streptomyces sp. 4N509B]|uniref:ABC transporter ATP-binding protein n=1 Tax=Streptomyces sp. 4N509B TaxID=3457413 RepID=UPI003FD68685
MADTDKSAVTVRGLTKVFLTRRDEVVKALHDITLSVDQGQILAILGPSGCGKSTLLRILAGLDRSYVGEVDWHDTVDGASSAARAGGGGAEDRLRCATVFQSDSTLPWLSVTDNVRLGMASLRLPSAEIARRVAWSLGLVGLADFGGAYPHELSGGMRQRVAIARALATRPRLLLMDEPLAALDAQTRLIMQEELLRLWEDTGSTIVYVTHDIEEAVTLAHRVIVLSARPGRVSLDQRIPFPHPRRVSELRKNPEFGELTMGLWQVVAEQVGQSLGAPRLEGAAS